MKRVLIFILKAILTVAIVYCSITLAVVLSFVLLPSGINPVLCYISMLALPSLLIPLVWLRKRGKFLKWWAIVAVVFAIALGTNYAIVKHEESLTIDVTPNINLHEYLPFDSKSKIVKLRSETLQLTDNLPVVDGAAAVFPVYSAFVNAVYPDTTKLHEGSFVYNNTFAGYDLLAQKDTDIFFGAYPSDEQIEYAKQNNTTFEYTPIALDAFVFFVHKDNPVENLTTEQIQGIYSGEITNWSQVGGRNEEIVAFQRNEGSGSQSMLQRFMGDKPIMEAPSELVNNLMVGIIERVSNYKSKTNSIGFSFRYYVESIVKNEDIKMICIDGIAPTAENIKNGSYPITEPFYAVTYAGNENENVELLIDWVLSDEGQYIIEQTGYVGIGN